MHEAYLRLVKGGDQQAWDNKGHFFASVAEAMRRILLNRARDQGRLKRGGDRVRLNLSGVSVASNADRPRRDHRRGELRWWVSLTIAVVDEVTSP